MTPELDLRQELRRGRFAHAFLATFCLDPGFFEQDCLEQYGAFEGCSNVVVFIDRHRHDAMLTDADERPRRAGLRYLLVPVRCAGVFHAKLYLFAGPDQALLLLGSANLTAAGFTRNAEFALALRIEPGKDERWAPLFGDARRFFGDIVARERAPRLCEALHELDVDCPWLAQADDPAPRRPRILHNLETPLWDQVRAALLGDPIRLTALSPFFDADPRAVLDAMTGAPTLTRAAVYTDRDANTMPASWLDHPSFARGTTTVYLTRFGDEQNRRLHAKALALAGRDQTVLAFGSANLSRAAWLATPANGNIETVLCLCDLPADWDADALMNPHGVQQEATSADLPTDAAPPPGPGEHVAVRLVEASLDRDELRLVVAGLPAHPPELRAELSFGAARSTTVVLRSLDDAILHAALTPELSATCSRGMTTLRIAGPEDSGFFSNWVVLIQPPKLRSGGEFQLARKIRDAQRGPDRFIAVLEELLQRGDDDLARFLRMFDVYIRGGSLPVVHQLGVGWSFAPRPLSARTFEFLAALGDVVADWFARHLRRIDNHVPDLEAAPRFLFAVRAVAGLACQWRDRLLANLDPRDPAKRAVLTSERWAKLRKHLNTSLHAFCAVMSSLERWIVRLVKNHGRAAVQAAIGEHAAILREHAATSLALPEGIAALKLYVHNGDRLVRANFFPSDILDAGQWTQWRRRVEAAIGRLP